MLAEGALSIYVLGMLSDKRNFAVEMMVMMHSAGKRRQCKASFDWVGYIESRVRRHGERNVGDAANSGQGEEPFPKEWDVQAQVDIQVRAFRDVFYVFILH